MTDTVLVVEDEPSIADNITYALSTEGFSPIWAATGGEALKILRTRKIDLLVLDIGLPDINGFELAKTIRKDSATPIIFVTARADEIDKVLGLELGADDYVVKPFSPRELTARVKAVLRRTRQAPTSNEAMDQSKPVFRIDEERLEIFYYGEKLELSRYEYRILRILVSRPGRVYSRGELMALAWEEPEMSLERTVDTHVKTVRKKLKALRPDEDPIKTHRGVGYSLRERG